MNSMSVQVLFMTIVFVRSTQMRKRREMRSLMIRKWNLKARVVRLKGHKR